MYLTDHADRVTPMLSISRNNLISYTRFPILANACLLLAFGSTALPANSQFYDSSRVVADGGIRFTYKNRDNLSMSGSSASGIRLGGSATRSEAGIKVGSASSEVRSELNPLFATDSGITGTMFVAGDESNWRSPVHNSMRSPKLLSARHLTAMSRGEIDQSLIDLLTSIDSTNSTKQSSLVESKNLVDSEAKVASTVHVFSDDFKRLQFLLNAKGDDGVSATYGVHVLQAIDTAPNKSNNRNLLARQSSPSMQVWARNAVDNQSQEVIVSPTIIPSGEPSLSAKSINLLNVQASPGTKSLSKFSVLGFSKMPNPNDGKRSAISAFATNNRTAGTATAEPGQTIADVAQVYGTSVQEIMLANNIASQAVDISGLPLTIPADLSTVGLETSLEGDTPLLIAERYNMDLSWLLDLNDFVNPSEPIKAGTKVRIPGRRPLGSPVLPPTKPQPPELEYADYGAYTTYEVTYTVKGALTPIFQRTLIEAFR